MIVEVAIYRNNMSNRITTHRLILLELTADELECYLVNPDQLEKQLGFRLSRDIITDRVRRAIRMKLTKMNASEPARHAWCTYWLIIIPEQNFGAGLIGYKGFPDDNGEAEIGYGIDPALQNKGYTTEASRAMIRWAFQEAVCRAVVARDTKKANLASNRVLEKLGMHIYDETKDAFCWRIERSPNTLETISPDPFNPIMD